MLKKFYSKLIRCLGTYKHISGLSEGIKNSYVGIFPPERD